MKHFYVLITSLLTATLLLSNAFVLKTNNTYTVTINDVNLCDVDEQGHKLFIEFWGGADALEAIDGVSLNGLQQQQEGRWSSILDVAPTMDKDLVALVVEFQLTSELPDGTPIQDELILSTSTDNTTFHLEGTLMDGAFALTNPGTLSFDGTNYTLAYVDVEYANQNAEGAYVYELYFLFNYTEGLLNTLGGITVKQAGGMALANRLGREFRISNCVNSTIVSENTNVQALFAISAKSGNTLNFVQDEKSVDVSQYLDVHCNL